LSNVISRIQKRLDNIIFIGYRNNIFQEIEIRI